MCATAALVVVDNYIMQSRAHEDIPLFRAPLRDYTQNNPVVGRRRDETFPELIHSMQASW